MKLGICSNWGPDLETYRTEIRTAAAHGYEAIGIGDTPAGWHDMIISLTLAAIDAPGAILTPMVTAPFLRHPLASVNAFSSLYDISGGRAVYGLATGGSNVMAMGRGRATQEEIRTEFKALRDLFAGRGTEWQGKKISPYRMARPVPIYYSAFAPKAFALAGEMADGVILFTGNQQLDQLQGKIDAVHAGARAAGRDPKEVDIWVISFTSVRPTRAECIADLMAFIAVNAITISRSPERMAATPEKEREKIKEFRRRYDVTEHVVVGGKNTALMEELGLTDYLSPFSTTMGNVQEVTEFLRKLEGMGVSTFFASLPGHGDPLATVRDLANARAAM
jgi:5,10-methylenetetrahydromethanopterin reductase